MGSIQIAVFQLNDATTTENVTMRARQQFVVDVERLSDPSFHLVRVIVDELISMEQKTASVRPPFKFGCMKGKMWMAEDFDAPLEDMKEYME